MPISLPVLFLPLYFYLLQKQLVLDSLMYLSVMTCPDITFAVSMLSKYLESPATTHLIAIKHVIHYLKGTKHLHLTLGSHKFDLSGYSDAD